MDKKYFLTTTDEETMGILIQNGFKLVDVQSNRWTFLNDASNKMSFDNKEMKYTYTNRLCI